MSQHKNGSPSTWLSRTVSGAMSASPANVFWGGSKGFVGKYPGASAGYSLRKLGSGPVVRLRRAIDSAEKDFSAGEVVAGTAGAELITNGDFSGGLTGWTADSNWTESGGQAVSDGSVSFGRLYQDNLVSSDAGIYYKVTLEVISATNFTSVGFNVGSSTRLFSFQSSGISSVGTYTAIFKTIGGGSRFGFYTSPASLMTIDNVSVKEYTPSAAELWAMNSKDEFSRQPFESAFCTTWYDQSGNGVDATQAVSTAQPLLIRAGVTNTENGKAALSFDGVDDELSVGSNALSTARQDSFMVMQTSDAAFIALYDGGPRYGWLANDGDPSTSIHLNFGTPTLYANGVEPAQADRDDIHSALSTGSQVLASTSDSDTSVWTDWRVGKYGSWEYAGDIQEIIIYPSDQSANRIPIEDNISKAWCIPYPAMNLVGDCRAPEMAAGYSLRDLGGGGNVVRLRRASDNEEQDFTAADIKAGTAGSELITNGRFSSGLTGWTADSNWTESGGQAVSDGSVSFGLLYQDNIISSDAGVYYKVTFEVPSFSNPTSVGFNIGTSIKLITLQNSGITSTGTYTAIFKTIGGGSRFGFYTGPAHTMTIDNVSVKEYTPSALELWAMNSRDEMSRQTNESAFCTTWYDQSASNEQVFEDPTITGSWTETDPNGEVAVTSGLVRFSNVTTSCSTWASGSEDIPAGTYRFELDYENNTATGVNNILVGIHTIINFNIGVSYPAGSGTISFVATVGTAGKLKITAAGTLDGSQSFDITGIRVVDLGNPATQSTSTAQPLLIRAGVTATENGKAALEFDGTDDFLTAPSYGVSQPIWSASVTKLDPSGSLTNRYLYCTQDNSFFTIANSNDFLRMHAGTSMTESSGGYSENQQLLTFAFDSINSGGWANGQGITFSTNDAGTGGISANMDIGRRIAAGNDANWNGGIQELIFYPSDQSANRTIIETSINAYYGIWLDDPWNDFNSWSDNLIWSED